MVLTSSSMLLALLAVIGFLAFLIVGSILLPGRRIERAQDGGVPRIFKLNGLALFLTTALIVGICQAMGWFSLSFLYNHFIALLICANVLAFALSGWLYWRGSADPDASKGFLHGFFFGRELNPGILGVDLKFFSYRPSLIALALFNVSFAVAQYEIYGELSLAMILYQIFTFAYVFNYFQFEYGMVHTWDIVSERFGWMLVWGNFVLVPFFYCIAGLTLVHAKGDLPLLFAIILGVLYVFGFWLFRGANEQKHRFKQDENTKIWGRPAETLDGRLLVSGFWGIGRHLNYTGEICVYLAFVLTVGFESWIPYLLLVWLVGLLWHRSWRDERRCRKKYGELWDRYVERARFSMIPFVH